MDATVTSDRVDVAPPGFDVLDALAIESALQQAWSGRCQVEAVAVTRSTNEDLVTRARTQRAHECVLRAATFQTSGRGRHRRAWHARPGNALLFSIAVPIATAGALPAVTLACGVAVADCLTRRGLAVQLKWPNDVLVDGRKLAGILSELVADSAGRQTLIVGVGVNWNLDGEARRAIGQPAVALEDLMSMRDEQRESWIGQLGGAVLGAVERFMRDGFDPFHARFNQLLDARGEMVNVFEGDREAQPALRGRVLEVDRSGCLVIEADGVHHAVSSGDVSVRSRGR